MADAGALAQSFLGAIQSSQLYTPPSATEALDETAAYMVQRAFVELRSAHDRVAGYKAAANAEALQQRLGLTGPITGVLFAAGERQPGSVIPLGDYRTLLVETEIGYRPLRRIDARLDSIDAVRAAMASCGPIVELADPGFGRVRFVGTDMIASNSATGGFICGAPSKPATSEVNTVAVHFQRDGETLHRAVGSDLMGDQWRALQWLVNQVVGRGYVIEPQHLLMTGSLGPAHPALPGRYTADFGAFGRIEFTVAS